MPAYTQANGPMAITTPLGPDALLLMDLEAHEAISELFRLRLDLLALKETKIPFEKIVGESVTVEVWLRGGGKRYFNGIVNRFTQANRDDVFTHFRAEVVPRLWLLTKRSQSRIFQHLTVPQILKEVLTGLDVQFELLENYEPRDYCVQYRESDFAFASRLMEEEGIYYLFKHAQGSHQIIVSDSPTVHPDLPGQSQVRYEDMVGGPRDELRVRVWEKTQELRSGKYTLWDHCFELPGKNLESRQSTVESVQAGTVTHKLSVGGNDQLELYDYPGGYAQRFDGVDPSGGERPRDVEQIFPDGERTVKIRMEQEETLGLEIRGVGYCRHFLPGYKFTLTRHFDGDGPYLLTQVEHHARCADFRSSEGASFEYENRFACIPAALPYRPRRVTPKPTIAGTQTATVVGPKGEEIFCDKYGRVKVQFHWDRQGRKNADSSCWLRVAQVWAGKGWGAFFWPRIGHEVVVAFEEGDPDQPQIIGSVYNAENMPWFGLPVNKKLAGFKSATERGSAHEHYNGIVFNDTKGHEHLAIHSERNMSFNSEFDKMINAGRHKGERIGVANVFTVGKLLPPGGGSGGGFDQGNPMPKTPPTGIVGINSVVTYGENFQGAVPLNHQLAVGNNLQLCVNPLGLLAGVPGMPIPGIVAAVLGGGMGGNMQFTIGTNAQFTLGQAFEIDLGPPKIAISGSYGDHPVTTVLCGLLGAATILWVIAYDHYQGSYNKPQANWSQEQLDQEQQLEQSGDKERANLAIAYQATVDVLLTAIMVSESLTKRGFWAEDDALKALFAADRECLALWAAPTVPPTAEAGTWWWDWGLLGLGGLGVLAAIAAPLAAMDAEK